MNKVSKVLKISLITNFFLSIFKLIVGVIGKSGALIADGIHSFSDLITDLIGIVGAFFSKKPSDEKHPFGHGKIEYLISIFIGCVILILGLSIISSSIKRSIIIPSVIVIFVSIFTIIVKFFLAHYLVKKGKEFKSNILISSGRESSTDVISSIVVLISSIFMQINISFLKYSDIVAGVLVGIFVIKVGLDVLKENISNILGETVTDIDYIEKIKKVILSVEHIKSINYLVIIKYGSYYNLISNIYITPNIKLSEVYSILEKLEKIIKQQFKEINYVNINIKS